MALHITGPRLERVAEEHVAYFSTFNHNNMLWDQGTQKNDGLRHPKHMVKMIVKEK